MIASTKMTNSFIPYDSLRDLGTSPKKPNSKGSQRINDLDTQLQYFAKNTSTRDIKRPAEHHHVCLQQTMKK